MTNSERLRRIRAIYEALPKIACQGHCHTSCGPVLMSRLERKQLPPAMQAPATLICPLLVNNRCSHYDNRPLVCRLWGIVEGMTCTFGCVPERYLTAAEEKAINAEVLELGHGVDLLTLTKLANNLERETATGQALTTSPGKLGNFTS